MSEQVNQPKPNPQELHGGLHGKYDMKPPSGDQTQKEDSGLAQKERVQGTPTSNFPIKNEKDIKMADTNFR